jgi:hypothetical protein
MTDTTDTPARTIAETVDAYLEQLGAAALGTTDLLHPDVRWDATVPHWRYRLEGDEAVRKELGSWYSSPLTDSHVVRHPTGDGEVVDISMRFTEGGVDWTVHHLIVLGVEEGRVRSITVACGGRWDPELVAQIGPAAHAG